jgi:hypothetical protein
MGVDACALRFLVLASQTGVSFERSLMLGRQNLHCAPWETDLALRDLESAGLDAQRLTADAPYADGLFRALGASEVESMDASAYEEASIVHSLNEPIPETLAGSYSLVFDGGTLEHVFDVRTAWSNAMRLVAVGGHFVGVTTANNHLGHGFYQFSPEFLFRTLSPANGFLLEGVFLHEQATKGFDRYDVYEVLDPATLGRRVTLINSHATLMYFRARKMSSVPPLAEPAIQSDYAVKWESPPVGPAKTRSALREQIRRLRFGLKRQFRLADRLRHGLVASSSPAGFDPTAYQRWTLDASMAKRWPQNGEAPPGG